MSTRKITSRHAFALARLVATTDGEAGWYAGECPCGWYYVGTYGLFERHADVCHRLAHLREQDRIVIGTPFRCTIDESGGVA